MQLKQRYWIIEITPFSSSVKCTQNRMKLNNEIIYSDCCILGMHTNMAASQINSCRLIKKKKRKDSVFTSGQIMIETVV